MSSRIDSLDVLPRAFGAVEGGAAFGGIEQLDCGHDVQHPVDLTVPASGQPVANVVPRGGVDRGGADPGAEVVLVRKPAPLTDVWVVDRA